MSNTDSTLGKIKVMNAYIDGKDIIVHAKKGIDDRVIVRNIKIFGQACGMGWNWEDYTYDIMEQPKVIKTEKFTNVMDGAVYGLFATKKEAIYHSDNRYDRAGVKVKITEITY